MNDDPFSPENAPALQLVVSMRIYDVLMALLKESNPEDAAKLHELHQGGKVLFSLPWLDIGDEDSE